MVGALEALLIEALEPPQNRKRGDNFLRRNSFKILIQNFVTFSRILVVVYTWRGDSIRLISARKADRSERQQYLER